MATKNPSFKIILGSSSKARKQILTEMGYEFTIMTADIDEQSIRREKPEDLVVTLAEAKAIIAIQWLLKSLCIVSLILKGLRNTRIINYYVVVYRGTIREKPTSEKEAREFVKGYSGSHAAVVGSVVVTNLVTRKRYGGWESAEVYFLEIPDEVIDNLEILVKPNTI
ncbi:unnamed protein product [Trifolium pratense]|uniref:Uncharacterized protein n=1 Tax=Trifolium pratense TaxID=57577 RepID=A0ACB0ITQ9_TRIPR|nr:unnamed protein product [Trifolium pratense]